MRIPRIHPGSTTESLWVLRIYYFKKLPVILMKIKVCELDFKTYDHI